MNVHASNLEYATEYDCRTIRRKNTKKLAQAVSVIQLRSQLFSKMISLGCMLQVLKSAFPSAIFTLKNN
jgi:hypothetical protein